MLKTGTRAWKAVSVALALSLSTALTVPPAFAGDSDNSPEMSGRYSWQQRGDRVYRARDRSRARHHSRSHRRNWDRDRRHWNRDRRHNRRHGRHHRRHRNNDAGAAILGGIIGLGAGLAIGNATKPRSSYDGGRYPAWSTQWYRYCENRYRSFNPRTGYFLGYDGQYHFCRAR